MVDHLARKGVRLWVENGRPRYKAPKGALSQEDIDSLRAFRDEIVALVDGANTAAPGAETLPRTGVAIHLVPLAYSQLAHWHTYRLGQGRSYCIAGFPTRWRGPLNVPALRRALREIVQRHDALRTRIVVWHGTPLQEIRDFGDCDLILDDLTGLEEGLREAELQRCISRCMLDAIDVTEFPLFRFRLIRVREDDHVLVTAMEHIITDGVSLNLLQREIFCVYEDLTQERIPQLPPVGMQFSEYAIWQRIEMQSWREKYGNYWEERMRGCKRAKFPASEHDPAERRLGFGCIRIDFCRQLTDELRQWCRQNGTTLVMSFFVAYVALVLKWCNVAETVVLFQVNGRNSNVTEHTFGYLASPLYLRVELLDADNFIDLLRRVTQEYCNAHEHADYSYLEAQLPPPDFASNSRFNWLRLSPPVDLGAQSDTPEQAVKVSWFPFEPSVATHYERDIEPVMGFTETNEGIVGYVQFPLARFSAEVMSRFARNFVRLMETLLRCPSTNVKRIGLE